MGILRVWVDAGAEAEFEGTDRKSVYVEGGRDILVLKVEGAYYAVSNICSHAHAFLLDGERDGHALMCPLHGASFDIRTGLPLTPPAVRPLDTYATRVRDGRVWIRV